MRTISIPEARKYCKERGWEFYWYRDCIDGKLYRYEVIAHKKEVLKRDYKKLLIVVTHTNRRLTVQAVYEAVKLFEGDSLKPPSAYIKRRRPVRRVKI